MSVADEVKPKIVGGRVVDYKKYIIDTPHTLDMVKEFAGRAIVLVVGKTGKHIVAWYLADWRVNKVSHIKDLSKVRRPGIYIYDAPDPDRPEKIRPPFGCLIVQSYRKGLHVGVSRVFLAWPSGEG